MPDRTIFLKLALDRNNLRTAFRISLIVGAILNLINQGHLIFDLRLAEIDYVKFFLTFLVPFLVSTYASTTTKLQFFVGELAFMEGQLVCQHCKMKVINLNKGDVVPACENCQEKTKWKLK